MTRVDAMDTELNDRLQRMLDHSEIRDVLARYARGIDRADGELLKTCYYADAIEEHAREDLGMVKEGETFYQVVE